MSDNAATPVHPGNDKIRETLAEIMLAAADLRGIVHQLTQGALTAGGASDLQTCLGVLRAATQHNATVLKNSTGVKAAVSAAVPPKIEQAPAPPQFDLPEEYQAEQDAQQWYDPLSLAATTAKSRAADGWERHHYKPEAAYKKLFQDPRSRMDPKKPAAFWTEVAGTPEPSSDYIKAFVQTLAKIHDEPKPRG